MSPEQYKSLLKAKQSLIQFESDEDQGAQEYWGDLQSIIDVIDNDGDIPKIKEAADWVGEQCPL